MKNQGFCHVLYSKGGFLERFRVEIGVFKWKRYEIWQRKSPSKFLQVFLSSVECISNRDNIEYHAETLSICDKPFRPSKITLQRYVKMGEYYLKPPNYYRINSSQIDKGLQIFEKCVFNVPVIIKIYVITVRKVESLKVQI